MNPLELIKSVLPFIGTALGGPLGGAAATFIGSKLGIPDATVKAVTTVLSGMDPAKLAEFKQHDQEFQVAMAKMGYDSIEKLEELNVSVIQTVNTTMQVEAKSEHWASWFWRPYIGFTFGSYIMSLWILPLFKVTPVTLSPEIVLVIGGILGVASWGRTRAMQDVNNTAITKG